jgi:hypothetical protein
MSRATLPVSFVVVFGAIGLAAAVSCLVMVFSGSLLAGSPDSDPVFYSENSPARMLREKLARPITLDKGIGPSCTLNDALEFLSEQYAITIIVDSNAFASIGVMKVEEQPVQLPKMSGVPLSTVLRLLVGQIKGDTYVGAFHIRNDYIEITTTYHQFMSPMSMAESGRPHVPMVTVEGRGQNLEEALAQLADSTSINVLLDARVRDRARRVTVTTSLREVPMDTALRMLADMADLGVAITDNLFYVTDVDNARVLQSTHERWLTRAGLRPDESSGAAAPGGGLLPGPAPAPPGGVRMQ